MMLALMQANFDDVLVPSDHVSRSSNDTFYVDEHTVLRCHTSAHQVSPHLIPVRRSQRHVIRPQQISGAHLISNAWHSASTAVFQAAAFLLSDAPEHAGTAAAERVERIVVSKGSVKARHC